MATVSGRPSSGRFRPLSSGKSRTQSGGHEDVSYEDMLVAQYLDELRKSPQYGRPQSAHQQSPYLQRLAHTHIVPTPNLGRLRPQSAVVGSSTKPRVDAKFIDDQSLWEATNQGEKKKRRPASAPVYKRPLSATYSSLSRPTSAKSGRWRARAVYRRQPIVIVATAYRNGSRDVTARVAAPSIKVLLEQCTERLGLPNAARRVFLDDGTEVFTPKEIMRDADLFISMGEPFKSPSKDVKQQTSLSKNATWTMNGLVLTAPDGKKKTKKTTLSKRFRTLIEQSRRRVLVFRNGHGHGSQGVEIVADPDRFEDFLVACTAKCDLGSYARVLYDWEGKEVQNLEDAPVLDACLQTGATHVLGPLWVSKGEGFSPKGVSEFLEGLITYTKSKLREAKHYKKQLQMAQHEDTKDDVEIVAILSMSDSEIEETLDIVAKDIDDFSNALNRLKEQLERIQDKLSEEASEGFQYQLKHIERIQSDHKLVGTKGIRLKVYENASYENEAVIYVNLAHATRGIGNDKDMVMARLLDQCSGSSFLANPKKNPSIRPIAKKLYNNVGKEIKSVYDLESDMEVWLSYGEPWKNPFTYVLSAFFDRAKVYEKPGGVRVCRETLMTDDSKDREKPSKWDVITGIPEDVEVMPDPDADSRPPPAANSPEGADGIPTVADDATDNEVKFPENATLLRCKDEANLLLYPSIVVDTKRKKGSGDLWPAEAQVWVISKGGYIYSKAMPSLVLSVTDVPLTTTLSHPTLGATNTKAEGYVVSVTRKAGGSAAQTWNFTADGYIYASSHPDLVLTFLGSQFGNEDSQVANESEEGQRQHSGSNYYVAVCGRLEGKDAKNQRWGLKQERYDNLGQWKHTRVENPEWNKAALSWPTNENGELNEEYDWPMEGFLQPYAPPLKGFSSKKGTGLAGVKPLRLMVLKNGVRDVSKSVAIVGPDLTNMRKDTTAKDKKGRQKRSRQSEVDADSVDADEPVHCNDDLTVLKLELILFLERCTSMLDLPFAARRVFDESGKEHFSLRTLHRDQLVYVSCGDPWSDPSVSKAEQQRRFLLTNLADDVSQIRQFVSLRSPENMVLEVEGSLGAGSRLTVGECALVPDDDAAADWRLEEQARLSREEEQRRRDDAQAAMATRKQKMTAHEVAHERADQRLNSRKWPWERSAGGAEGEEADEEAENYTNKDLYQKFRRRQRRTADNTALQKFLYDDGYIACSQNADLVLGVQEQEGRAAEVILVRRRPDDIHQRWTLQDNGLIQAKHNPQLVLTVSLPSSFQQQDEDGMTLPYAGCTVTLQSRKVSQFGRANQRWRLDSDAGFIQAFYTDQMDKEITAANRANVCTYAVVGDVAIDQPGYTAEIQTAKGAKPKRVLVCSSCARAMRGRHKLDKVQGHVDFACAMGTAKEHGVKQVGSFRCLNGKVDLSTHEAEHTLTRWEEDLNRLKDELSVRAIAKEISAAHVPYTVKVLAYRNGEGRLKAGEVIVGSSVPGILDQCTHRMGLRQAGRRLYTVDGTITMDIDDLVIWVREDYVRGAQKQLRAEARAKRRADKRGQGQDQSKANLMDKVQLESDLETSEEEEEEEETEEVANSEDKQSQDIFLGYNTCDRHHMDPVSNMVVLPNPAEEVEQAGYIVAWKLFARQMGPLALQVLRPSRDDLTAFILIGQVMYQVSAIGEQTVDISETPIEVKRGDLIGFHCLADPIIPYDVDQATNQAPFYLIPKMRPDVGDILKMESIVQDGMRKYSLSALVVPASRLQESSTNSQTSAAAGPAPKREKKKARARAGPHVDLPPVDMVLRYPIEVWVSCGEGFVKPQSVEKSFEREQQLREERAAVAYELDKEKHVLRHMQGRRREEQNPGEFRATRNPQHPVLIQGHWQEPSMDELHKHDTVNQLQTHLSEMKIAQKAKGTKPCNVGTTKRLYTQPTMKRLMVFPNGEIMERAQPVWGETLAQVLDNASTRLSLRKPAKYLFTMEGRQVEDLSEVARDQLLCVSAAKQFQLPRDSRQAVEVKANWGRARKQYGPQATDIMVVAKGNQHVNVDPFGPSALAGGQSQHAISHVDEDEPIEEEA